MTKVNQSDREAMVAYENARPIPLNPEFATAVIAGSHDHDRRVQAFAAHRQAALIEGARLGIEAAAKQADDFYGSAASSLHAAKSESVCAAAVKGNIAAAALIRANIRALDPAAVAGGA